MTIRIVRTTPYDDQRPGTSGLRKKARVFAERPHYLETFIQAVFDALGGVEGARFVLGGDGRWFSDRALDVILRMMAANGVAEVRVGQHGWLSTPAASCLIRKYGATGGILLSASHNPGGPDGDFGIKINIGNGGPAPERLTEAIWAASRRLTCYRILEEGRIDLEREGEQRLGGMRVRVVDPVADHAELLAGLFDFDAIRALFRSGFRMLFDAMHGITGPYARRILEQMLGAPAGTVLRGDPLPDFGGLHPDPQPVSCRELVARMLAEDAPDFAAASDGDGDRNLILGRGLYVTPSDSLAILAAHAGSMPGYRRRLTGVARSLPTSRAVDRVAEALGLACYETPTGWKFFGNLLDAGRIQLCGEESFGTGSDHLREKDGMWAVLAWLHILATTRLSVREIVHRHWQRFGRDYYTRHDYEGLEAQAATDLLADLRRRLPALPGTAIDGVEVVAADDFAYVDPVDGSRSERQGIRILFADGARVVYRLSGTGTEGATLRVYIERYARERLFEDTQAHLAPVIARARALSGIAARLGRSAPDVIT
ncbi:Phosphoglucomutase [bacterium HR40]|nr:Phosphoglucomutase [bacterium HR40]